MFPQQWIEAYLRFLLRRRRTVSVVVALITLFFAYSLKDLRLHSDFFDFYPRHHPYIQFYNEFRQMFGTPNIMSVILEVKRGDIYNPATLQKLDRITKFMVYTKGVVPYQISSIAHPSVKSVVPTGQGTIEVREIFYPTVPQTQDDADRVRFSVYANQAVRGVYTASDDTAAVVHTAFWEEALDFDYLYGRMMELKRTEEDANHVIYITGFPWLYASILQYVPQLNAIFVFTVAALSFLLYAYFRTWTGIWVPVFSGLLSSVWGLAIAVLLGFNLDPLVLVIPIFLTARALSHSVQSMDRYHEEFYRLSDKQQAIVVSYSHLFAPAIASIVTDGIGLLVVAVAPIPLVQKVAIFASFWVVSIFVSVVTLHPIILSYIDAPPRRHADQRRRQRLSAATATALMAATIVLAGALSRAHVLSPLWGLAIAAPIFGWYWLGYSEAVYAAVTRSVIQCSVGARRWVVIGLTVALYGLLPIWGWQLKVGDMSPGAALLFPDHPFNVAYRKLNDKFLGISQLIVIADTMKPDGVKDTSALRTMDEFADHMRGAPGARVSISIVDVVKQAARLWHEGDPKWGTVPDALRQKTELLFALTSAAGANVDRFMDPSARYASIITLFGEHSHDVIRDAIRWAKAFEPDSATLQFRYAGGLFGILAAVNESVENSYWLNLGLIFGIVTFCLYLTYGSWVAAVVLMIPVVLSQLAVEALMVLMHIDLNVNSLPVAAAGAGVGVDYGIYHFSRMIDGYDELGQLDAAVDYATATTGKAIIFTASTMIAGTMFWWFSDLKFLAEMGLMLALLMAFNTFGGLIVVPAFVKALRPAFLVNRQRSVLAPPSTVAPSLPQARS